MRDVQRASFAYRYRDVPTLKNPFDLALYMMLLSRLGPHTYEGSLAALTTP